MSSSPGGADRTGPARSKPPTDGIFVEQLAMGGAGARVGVKDSIDIAGFPTRMGSACFADAPPAFEHAAVVRALLAAGCRIVGKTNLHELAYGVTGINHWSGTPVNPRAPGRVPGGSSSGSAVAVATALVDFAIGTDTGGSIRIPAACCGVYGLKPSYGRVSRAGVHPARSTLDCVGPIARDLPTIERAMSMIEPSFRPQAAPTRALVGWVDVEANPEVTAAARGGLAGADVVVRPISLPSLTRAFAAGLTIIRSEIWAAFGHLLACERLGADVRTRLAASRGVCAAELADAEDVRRLFKDEVDEALTYVDAIALPTLPDFPLTLTAATDAGAALGSSSFVRPFNLSGHPALSLPLRRTGSPAALQLIGGAGQDEALCALAHTVVAERQATPAPAPG